MNVTNTDNYCSIYTNETFDLGKKWGTLVQTRTEDNRGHYVVGMGSGYDSQRVNNGGYNQLRGYILFESHDDDWAVIVNVEGSQHGSDRFGDDSNYSIVNASWEDQRYQGRAGGELMSEVPIEENDVPKVNILFLWLNAWDGTTELPGLILWQFAYADVTWTSKHCCHLLGLFLVALTKQPATSTPMPTWTTVHALSWMPVANVGAWLDATMRVPATSTRLRLATMAAATTAAALARLCSGPISTTS